MGSRDIASLRNEFPGKSDTAAAQLLADQYGYIAIVGYNNDEDAEGFTDIGTCHTEAEIRGYMTSPYCHNPEVLYDGRAKTFALNADHVLNGSCARCDRRTSRATLTLHAGNDFYFCPKCGALFCDDCYGYLPLTASPGYGMCPGCRVQVKRALPGFFISSPPAPATARPTAGSVVRDTGRMERSHLGGAMEQPQSGNAKRWWRFWR